MKLLTMIAVMAATIAMGKSVAAETGLGTLIEREQASLSAVPARKFSGFFGIRNNAFKSRKARPQIEYSKAWLDAQPKAAGGEQFACLAEALYFEARGETVKGQFAVAEVILNRVKSAQFPNSLCGVIKQGAENLNRCQFSYKCDGEPEYMTERGAKKRAADVAILMMKGERRALSGNATHYHADYVDPYWASKLLKTATVGTHIFYKRQLRRSASR